MPYVSYTVNDVWQQPGLYTRYTKWSPRLELTGMYDIVYHGDAFDIAEFAAARRDTGLNYEHHWVASKKNTDVRCIMCNEDV